MADSTIATTASFARMFAQARIWCPSCGHGLIVDQTMLNLMFPMPVPLDKAKAKLVCGECGARGAEIEVLRKPPR
jgi:transcription elongation factor Elf1